MILKTRSGMWGILIFFGFAVITIVFLARNSANNVNDVSQQPQETASEVLKVGDPDETRLRDIKLILDAAVGYVNDGGHSLSDFGEIPTCNVNRLKIGAGELDLSKYLVPKYIKEIPVDPDAGTLEDTGYTLCVNNHGSINISAPFAAQSKMQVLNQ